MRPLFGVALLAACASTSRSGEERAIEVDTSARISVTHPWFNLPKGRVHRAEIRIDGALLGECDAKKGLPPDRCLNDVAIAPGPHTLDILLFVQGEDEPYRGTEALAAAPFDRIVFDLEASNGITDQTKYVTHVRTVPRGLSKCFSALVELAHAPSCRGLDLAELGRGLERAEDECDEDDSPTVLEWLPRALRAHAVLDIDRCFAGDDINRLPRRMTSASTPRDWWPSNAPLDRGSWSWSRAILLDGIDSTLNEEGLFRRATTNLEEAGKRVEIVDLLAAAYLAPEDQVRVRAVELSMRARAMPFTLDARTPEGHLAYLMLADPERFYDASLAEHVAREVAKDESLHCGVERAASIIMGFLTEDRALSEIEWKTVRHLAERTPADQKLDECIHAADADLDSPVSARERLDWFASYDCGAKRSDSLRGRTLAAYVGSEADWAEQRAKESVRGEWAHCLESVHP